MTRLLTTGEVAEILGKEEPWVANAARSGVLPGHKVGRDWRFTQACVDAYLDRVQTGMSAPSPRRRRRAS